MKKEKRTPKDSPFSLGDRIRYRFDNIMSKGSLGFIRVLIIASLILAAAVAGLIILFGFNEDADAASVFWNSIATVINAWMPSYEDGSPGYIILMSLTAVAGVFFTSVLIGIITSAIEEKLDSLKRGNSLVLERDHVVVLGFYPGEYALLRHLILAAAGKPACVVLADDVDRTEMEQGIDENLDVPKNFRIICRTVDITDPASLEKCSIETCKTVIVTPTDDLRTIKTVLAVSALLEEKGVSGISVNAIISKDEHRFPRSVAEEFNITAFRTGTILAKMIAHSCTQTGLSEVFREIFNFEGCEFYITKPEGAEGLTFAEVTERTDNATPTGIFRGGNVIINPPADLVLEASDSLLVFSDTEDSPVLLPKAPASAAAEKRYTDRDEAGTEAVIIGYNETLPLVLRELPDNVEKVYLIDRSVDRDRRALLEQTADERDLLIEYLPGDPQNEDDLIRIARRAAHIVILNDHSEDPEEADMDAAFTLLSLRDIRKRYGLDFNITVEMQKEQNQTLAGRGDHTDFLVASSMSSLILAQIAESPELISVFREILSNKGNELYLKNAARLQLEGEHTVRELRRIMLDLGYILLGDINAERHSTFNRRLEEKIVLTANDSLIVIGEE